MQLKEVPHSYNNSYLNQSTKTHNSRNTKIFLISCFFLSVTKQKIQFQIKLYNFRPIEL